MDPSTFISSASSTASHSCPSPPSPPRSPRRTRLAPTRPFFPVAACICLLASVAGATSYPSSLDPPRLALLPDTQRTSPVRLPRAHLLAIDSSSTQSTRGAERSSSSSSVTASSSLTTPVQASIITLSSTGVVVTSAIATSGSTSAAGSHPASTTTSSVTPSSTAVPSGYSIPQAFDSSLGTNFLSTNCPSFFATFLANPTFVSCTPFSLLLSTSTGFFQAEKSPLSLLPYVLNASCSAPADTCRGLMAQLADQITHSDTCGPDLTAKNAIAQQALQGFQNYDLMRLSGCQKNNSTQQYCFVEASLQVSGSEVYFYYLPLGTSLPAGTKSNCESCTKGLMEIYAGFATNSTLDISTTYAGARSLAIQSCGPTFAPAVITAGTSTGSIPITPSLMLLAGLGLSILTLL